MISSDSDLCLKAPWSREKSEIAFCYLHIHFGPLWHYALLYICTSSQKASPPPGCRWSWLCLEEAPASVPCRPSMQISSCTPAIREDKKGIDILLDPTCLTCVRSSDSTLKPWTSVEHVFCLFCSYMHLILRILYCSILFTSVLTTWLDALWR